MLEFTYLQPGDGLSYHTMPFSDINLGLNACPLDHLMLFFHTFVYVSVVSVVTDSRFIFFLGHWWSKLPSTYFSHTMKVCL